MLAPSRATTRISLPSSVLTRSSTFELSEDASHTRSSLTFFSTHSPHALKCTTHKIDYHAATHCSHCTRAISAATMALPPLQVPDAFDAFDQVFITSGRFCSNACAKAAALERGSVAHALFIKYMSENGVRISDIKTAPPRAALVRFGGSLTDEEFDALCESGNEHTITTQTAPFVNAFSMTVCARPSTIVRGLRCPSTKEPLHIKDDDPTLENMYERFIAGQES